MPLVHKLTTLTEICSHPYCFRLGRWAQQTLQPHASSSTTPLLPPSSAGSGTSSSSNNSSTTTPGTDSPSAAAAEAATRLALSVAQSVAAAAAAAASLGTTSYTASSSGSGGAGSGRGVGSTGSSPVGALSSLLSMQSGVLGLGQTADSLVSDLRKLEDEAVLSEAAHIKSGSKGPAPYNFWSYVARLPLQVGGWVGGWLAG